MITAKKDLLAVNDEIILDNPTELDSVVTCQYVSGAGTVVIEGSHDKAVWFPMSMTKMSDKTEITNLVAAGGYRTECGFEFVKARKTVGVASCVIILGLG